MITTYIHSKICIYINFTAPFLLFARVFEHADVYYFRFGDHGHDADRRPHRVDRV